jgi:hypothetical protein
MMKIKDHYNSINELRTSLEVAKENAASKDKENKNLETLSQLRDNCFVVASRCCDTMKKIFPQ